MKKTKEINFQPHCVDSTKPENLISYTNIEVDGNVLENIGDYKADGDISFNIGQDYTDVDGIVTFRGNSFRSFFGQCSLDRKWLDRTAAYDEMAQRS